MSCLRLERAAEPGERPARPARLTRRRGQHAALDRAALDAGVDLSSYERIVVLLSGGKDSVACALLLLDLGVDPERIELHHHSVDGREGSTLMDWPITQGYCEALAQSLGLRLRSSWRVAGIEGELLRRDAPTGAVAWEREDGSVARCGGDGSKLGTRTRLPQVSPDLRVRWCSQVAKIDVFDRVLRHEPRFAHGRTLVVTGERAEESANRAKYRSFEPHRADLRDATRSAPRWIDQWRAIHAWSEADVWARLERHRINAHPAYHLGWGRASCLRCVFLTPQQWASARVVDPEGFEALVGYEQRSGFTLRHGESLRQIAERAQPFDMDPDVLALARSRHYPVDLIRVQGPWQLPAGAFSRHGGPS